MNKKCFNVRTVLSVTTGRLLTKSDKNGNGIGDLYQLLGHMTNDEPWTTQLGRFSVECKPWLLKWFPELAGCGTESALDELDTILATEPGDVGVSTWICRMMLRIPTLQHEYSMGQIPADDHVTINPVVELILDQGTDANIVIVDV